MATTVSRTAATSSSGAAPAAVRRDGKPRQGLWAWSIPDLQAVVDRLRTDTDCAEVHTPGLLEVVQIEPARRRPADNLDWRTSRYPAESDTPPLGKVIVTAPLDRVRTAAQAHARRLFGPEARIGQITLDE
ncbi:hypothetical protein [Rhodococcus sp. YH1]|uniref:hypothetical protein n=1 Tax=Rhodococcus sp. YH1 TaxID=89066 RepID=UPI001386AA75|nr:hypothetical protein [Rhodococcus sp. YH1]